MSRGGGSPGDTLLVDLVSFYTMEEASNATRIDSGPAGLNLTNTATVNQGTGVIDKAADFRGTSAKLTHTFDSNYDLSDTDFAITGWMNMDADVSSHALYIGKGGTGEADRVVNLIYLSGGTEMRFVISPIGGGVSLLADDIGGSIPIGSFFFFCISYNKTTKVMSLILNGQAPVTLVATGNPINFGNQSFVVGNSVSDQNPLVGRVDEVGFWRREITIAECAFLYNSGAGNRPNITVSLNVTNGDGTLVTNADLTQVTT